jgi:Helix-turn-helix domain
MSNRRDQKGRRRRRRHDGPKFIQLFRYVLDSEAYISLSPSARAALVEVNRGYNGQNNGRIVLSVRNLAQRMNCHRNTAAHALQELVEKGFIEPRIKGWFSVKFRHATEWCLTDRRCDATGNAQSQAFQKWAPAPTPSSNSEVKFKTRSQKLGPDGPKKQDTIEIQNPNPRSQKLGHCERIDGPKNQDTSKSTIPCSPQDSSDVMDAPVQSWQAKPAVHASTSRPARRATPRGDCLARTEPWKAVGMSRSGWYAAGKPMDANGGGLRAAKLPWSTPTLTEDRRLSGMLGTESAPDDGIPEFLRRTPNGAAS